MIALSSKWGNRRKREALKKVVFQTRYDEFGNIVYHGDVCYLCGRKIDLKLPKGLPGSPEMEDLIPVSRGGNPLDPDNLRPAHKGCNARKRDKSVEVAIRLEKARSENQTSRIW